MINQIQSLRREARPATFPASREVARIRRGQTRSDTAVRTPHGLFWNPLMTGSYLSPITRRI
jgi:hypothetical protein